MKKFLDSALFLYILPIVFEESWQEETSKEQCSEYKDDYDLSWFETMVPEKYNQKEPPKLNGCPSEVNVSIAIWSIGEISIERMYFEVNVYINLRWVDHRLNIPTNFTKGILLPSSIASKVWTPQVGFRNCMSCQVLNFDANTDKLRQTGNVLWFYLRSNPKIFCDFDISNYPMDRHSCSIEVSPAGDWINSLILKDYCLTHRFFRNASVPQFTVGEHTSGRCTTPDESDTYVSCIEYRIIFIRQIAYHLMITYVPSLLIVLLTWISFWLDIELSAARVALGLTSLLTLATQFANAQKNLPPVSYLKAIDVWMVMCMFMVFASLVEFAISYSLNEKKNVITVGGKLPMHPYAARVKKSTPASKNKKADKIARVVFPALFLVFNLCYWSYYITL